MQLRCCDDRSVEAGAQEQLVVCFQVPQVAPVEVAPLKVPPLEVAPQEVPSQEVEVIDISDDDSLDPDPKPTTHGHLTISAHSSMSRGAGD